MDSSDQFEEVLQAESDEGQLEGEAGTSRLEGKMLTSASSITTALGTAGTTACAPRSIKAWVDSARRFPAEKRRLVRM